MPPHNPDPEKLTVFEFQPEKSEGGNRTLRLMRATDLGDPKPADYVVKGLLNRGDLALIFGKAGCGKSLFAAHLFYLVAQGETEAYGKRVRGGPVIYVCLEGQGGFRRRLQALERAHGPAADFYLVEEPFSLVDPRAADLIESLIKQAQEIRPAAIIIDTWAQATGGDENGSDTNTRALTTINRLRANTGALVCGIDHTGWGEDAQKRPRGWSGKWAATDTGLRVDGDIKTGDVLVIPERLKDGTDFAPLAFGSERVELGIDEDGDPIEIYRGVERDAATRDQIQDRKTARSRALTPKQEGDLKVICEAIAEHGREEKRDGVTVLLIDRPALRNFLIEKDRLTDPQKDTSKRGEEHARDKSGPLRNSFRNLLNALKDRGKIDFDGRAVWRVFNDGESW